MYGLTDETDLTFLLRRRKQISGSDLFHRIDLRQYRKPMQNQQETYRLWRPSAVNRQLSLWCHHTGRWFNQCCFYR